MEAKGLARDVANQARIARNPDSHSGVGSEIPFLLNRSFLEEYMRPNGRPGGYRHSVTVTPLVETYYLLTPAVQPFIVFPGHTTVWVVCTCRNRGLAPLVTSGEFNRKVNK